MFFTKKNYFLFEKSKFQNVATLMLGSWSRQKGLKGTGQEECEKEDSHSQVSSPFESWSLDGLPNLHRAIAEVKTPRIKKFFISLESYWSLDV